MRLKGQARSQDVISSSAMGSPPRGTGGRGGAKRDWRCRKPDIAIQRLAGLPPGLRTLHMAQSEQFELKLPPREMLPCKLAEVSRGRPQNEIHFLFLEVHIRGTIQDVTFGRHCPQVFCMSRRRSAGGVWTCRNPWTGSEPFLCPSSFPSFLFLCHALIRSATFKPFPKNPRPSRGQNYFVDPTLICPSLLVGGCSQKWSDSPLTHGHPHLIKWG